jgi:hypothetical protein
MMATLDWVLWLTGALVWGSLAVLALLAVFAPHWIADDEDNLP